VRTDEHRSKSGSDFVARAASERMLFQHHAGLADCADSAFSHLWAGDLAVVVPNVSEVGSASGDQMSGCL
jgi:hypothetical protein